MGMAAFIFAAIVVGLGYIAYAIAHWIIERSSALRPTDIHTPLPKFRESTAAGERLLQSTLPEVSNISEKFERMCVREPRKYQNHPGLASVIEQYKKLLRGEIMDPDGLHVPSETIQGKRNPDYEIYLKAQREVLKKNKVRGKVRVMGRELKRIEGIYEDEDLRSDLMLSLMDMGFPTVVLDAVLSDGKITAYDADDWRRLKRSVKEYLSEYEDYTIAAFLDSFDEIDILTDADKLETFATYRNHGAPDELTIQIVRDNISIDQAVRMASLVDDEGYNWKEAFEEVLTEDIEDTETEALVQKYRSMVED